VPPITPTSPSRAPESRPTPAAGGPVDYANPVDVATRYVRATCPFDWHEPYGTREQRGAPYLTPAQAKAQAPSRTGSAEWTANVVRRHLVGTCGVLAAQVLNEAPNTAARRFVNVVARRSITENGGPPTTDQAEYTYVLLRLGGRWLIDRPSYGG
jgi:hypothetical protein